MNNDIETMLHEAAAPAMGVDPNAVITRAQRTRRRRRATVGAFGLAAALVIGVGAGTDNIVAHQRSVGPAAQYGTSGPLGKLFKGLPIGGDDGNGSVTIYTRHQDGSTSSGQTYVVNMEGGRLQLHKNTAASASLPVTQSLPHGITAFRDDQNTVIVAALPRGTDTADLVSIGRPDIEAIRLSAGLNIDVISTQQPGSIRGLIWSIDNDYYSSTGERGQVASFPGMNIYWFPKLNVYGFATMGAMSKMGGSPAVGPIRFGVPVKGEVKNIAFVPLPHGARDVQVRGSKGLIPGPPQIRRLGTSSYDLALVSSIIPMWQNPTVQSVTWTDSTGRHSKSFS